MEEGQSISDLEMSSGHEWAKVNILDTLSKLELHWDVAIQSREVAFSGHRNHQTIHDDEVQYICPLFF